MVEDWGPVDDDDDDDNGDDDDDDNGDDDDDNGSDDDDDNGDDDDYDDGDDDDDISRYLDEKAPGEIFLSSQGIGRGLRSSWCLSLVCFCSPSPYCDPLCPISEKSQQHQTKYLSIIITSLSWVKLQNLAIAKYIRPVLPCYVQQRKNYKSYRW